MEDWWKRAKTFAEEAAKKSQDLTNSATFADLISETTKKSKDLAIEASKKADQLKLAALKQADQFKSIADTIAPPFLNISSNGGADPEVENEKLGITDDLREFVKGFTAATFQNFTIHDDDLDSSDAPRTESNVRQDLNEWQAKHATVVLTTVKGISRLRYELCPRVMKEKRFWRIYFTLVSTHVAPYEKKYMEELKLKAEKQAKDDKLIETSASEIHKSESIEKNIKDKASTSSLSQQDLDSFLLGDLGDSDDGLDDGDHYEGTESFGDDLDKIENLDDDEDDKLRLI